MVTRTIGFSSVSPYYIELIFEPFKVKNYFLKDWKNTTKQRNKQNHLLSHYPEIKVVDIFKYILPDFSMQIIVLYLSKKLLYIILLSTLLIQQIQTYSQNIYQ